MTGDKRTIGRVGEDFAVKHLKRRGFDIIERNVLRRWGEIDIVAKRGALLVFVEVKTVLSQGGSSADYIRPEEQLGFQKMRKFKRAVDMYLIEKRPKGDFKWRLDLIAIELKPDYSLSRLEHIENILAD